MSGRVWIRVSVVLGALVLLLWAILFAPWESDTRASEAGGRSLSGMAVDDAAQSERVSSVGRTPAQPAVNRRRAVPDAPRGPGLLELRIEREDGSPARGEVRWVVSREPPVTANELRAGPGAPFGGDTQHAVHQGTASIRVPAGCWTWLEVTASGSRPLCAYERVPPFSGTLEKQIRLSASTRGIHVFVLESDFASPAKEQTVRLYSRSMKTGGPPTLLRSESTDGLGYVRFRSLEPGAFLACAPGAKPGDRPPRCWAFVMPANMSASEVVCTLVAAEPKVQVRLDVDAVFETTGRDAPKLFLRRLDDLAGGLHPMPGVLTAGKQEVVIGVPPGQYGVEVLPLGQLEVVLEDQVLQVPRTGSPRFKVGLAGRKDRIDVELVGISRKDLPVTVTPRPIGKLLNTGEELMFCGPYRWPRTIERIAAPSGDAFVVVSGRNRRFWISDKAVRFTGPRTRVNLVPATMVNVSSSRQPKAQAKAIVAVHTRLGDDALLLKPMLFSVDGVDKLMFTGSIVVPEGDVRLEYEPDETSGKTWSRKIHAKGSVTSVRIDA